MSKATDDNPEGGGENEEGPGISIRERFIFKHQLRVGYDVQQITRMADITGIEKSEEIMDRGLRSFFAFLEDLDFPSQAIFDHTLDLLLSARMRRENPLTFGKKIQVSQDSGFEAFLVRIRNFDEDMLKELYHIYIGTQSRN